MDVFAELYYVGDTPLGETSIGAALFVAIILWLVSSTAFGRPRFLLPRVLRTEKKAA